jgi:hypothetical protein
VILVTAIVVLRARLRQRTRLLARSLDELKRDGDLLRPSSGGPV